MWGRIAGVLKRVQVGTQSNHLTCRRSSGRYRGQHRFIIYRVVTGGLLPATGGIGHGTYSYLTTATVLKAFGPSHLPVPPMFFLVITEVVW